MCQEGRRKDQQGIVRPQGVNEAQRIAAHHGAARSDSVDTVLVLVLVIATVILVL
jgi:hypothetical protein